MSIKIYSMVRLEDVSGVSGSGITGEAVEFSDGTFILHWLTDISSFSTYKSMEDAIKICGHSGKTKFIEDKLKSHA